MTRVVSPKRRGVISKHLDLARVRSVFADGRSWTTIGLVTAPDSGAHFTVEDDDVIIEVVTQPDLIPLSCRLMACSGVWLVPAAGEEVGVIIPAGDIGFMPLAIPILSGGVVPENVGEAAIVIARTKVYIHDGTGPTTALARASHTHLDSNGIETSAAISGTDPNPTYNPMLPPGPGNELLISTGDDGGTGVLEAK